MFMKQQRSERLESEMQIDLNYSLAMVCSLGHSIYTKYKYLGQGHAVVQV